MRRDMKIHMKNQRNLDKNVWIDLDNSPHVPFFIPIISKLYERRYHIELTARDCFQVCGLAELYKLNYHKIGRHFGKKRILKIAGTILRAAQLIFHIYKAKPCIAISHGSRALMIAASFLKIPHVLILDYEYVQLIPLLKPALFIAPDVIVHKIKNRNQKIIGYPGIKEDVYVPFFRPDKSIIKELEIEEKDIIVTVRPPANEAHYHNPESENLFEEVLNMLGAHDGVKMVILPRNEIKQTALIREKWPQLFAFGKAVIPPRVVDGLNLIWHSDLVISGGGTMNREAAALGVPVYSIFRGKIGAVDKYLSENGRLCLLGSKEDVHKKIEVKKRRRCQEINSTQSTALDAIVGAVVSLVEKGKG